MTTTIQIRNETKEKIRTFGIKGESYDIIINRLYDMAIKQQLREFLFSKKGIPIDEAIARAKKRWQK